MGKEERREFSTGKFMHLYIPHRRGNSLHELAGRVHRPAQCKAPVKSAKLSDRMDGCRCQLGLEADDSGVG
ncbi:hypothetical protein QG37_04244 [Candidozyma auris]|nr:hypothetical protein QG37_04244 [[Candida] auris]